ncbi:MAG: cation-translocating P-type ATPase [Patescibacteria group bacterium]|jgi:Ca2+-transporting ATPase
MVNNYQPNISDGLSGLTAQEAEKRQQNEGFNELQSQKRQSVFRIFIEVVREPMLMLLIAIGVIYLFLGELRDALVLLLFVMVVLGITFFQKRKTERALEALRNLSSPRALVVRDGQQVRISGREVVRGDIYIISEGDRVPADGSVISSNNLLIDESLLTGESLPVRKSEWDRKAIAKQPGGDDQPFVYSGTMVVQGTGVVLTTAIGIKTEMGKIGAAINEIKEEDTLLQKETRQLVKNFALVGINLCLIVVLIYGLVHSMWLKGLLSGLTLGMAILPEEFSVVLVIFMALGAWRISKSRVLTRRMPSIETLGATSVLCVDKTGTLTQNRMTLETVFVAGSLGEITKETDSMPDKFHPLLEYALLASQADPFDPIEKAIQRSAGKILASTEHLHPQWNLVREYPLSKELLAISRVWVSPDQSHYVVAAKGAPEAILDLCHVSQEQHGKVKKIIDMLADRGLRLIGVARAVFERESLPSVQHDFNFEFIGLLGFADPVRETVANALEEAYTAGMRVIMITGDYPGTARYIAKEVGLHSPEKFLNGSDIASMSEVNLREKIRDVNIFSRMVPEQKLSIVKALKANGEVVAMTGDGVNDAPALKSAHVGIAMGQRGTDVAREAAALVLLDDDFSSIVRAVRLGRRIFDNLKKSMSYILAVHVPIAGIAFLPVVFNLPVVLLPVHIAFLELIIDPACSVVFENDPEEKDIMKRPPRSLREPILSRKSLLNGFLQGASVLVVTFAVYLITYFTGQGENEARTLTFVTLVVANLLLIVSNLSWTKSFFSILKIRNTTLWIVLGGAVTVLALIISLSFLRNLFHLSVFRLDDILIVLTAGLVSVLWFELLKKFRRRRLIVAN